MLSRCFTKARRLFPWAAIMTFLPDWIKDLDSHTLDPLPVVGYMDQDDDDHSDAAPGVDIAPSVSIK